MGGFWSRLGKAFSVLVTPAAPDKTDDSNQPLIPPPAPDAAGTVTVNGNNYGQSVGVNLGQVILQRLPSEDERRFLIWYLDTLASELGVVMQTVVIASVSYASEAL